MKEADLDGALDRYALGDAQWKAIPDPAPPHLDDPIPPPAAHGPSIAVGALVGAVLGGLGGRP